MVDPELSGDRIVDAALELAAEADWETVRLHAVAGRLGVGLERIHAHFSEKEDLVEAFFDRADLAMLRRARAPDFARLNHRERLEALTRCWLDVLEPHRHAVRGMIRGKLEPGHLHVQIPALLRVSRTVQWLREAAGLDAIFVRRAVEETVLTSIFLATFARWLANDSGAGSTYRFLHRSLRLAEHAARGLGPLGRPRFEPGMETRRG